MIYLLPWRERSEGLYITEAVISTHPIVGRVERAAGLWIGKIVYGIEEGSIGSNWFKKVCHADVLAQAIDLTNDKLVNLNCKFINPKLIVMI